MLTSVHSDVLKLSSEMLRFTSSIEKLDTPDAVLDGLHKATHQATPLNVLAAALFPVRWGDFSGVEKGKTVFLERKPSAATSRRLRPNWAFTAQATL